MGSSIIFNKPAEIWEEALPLGNGRLGAMVFSGVNHELIQVNEESVWYGAKRDRHNPDAFENLNKVRELIKEGHPKEAEKLMGEAFCACPAGAHPYQTLGNINILFEHDKYVEQDESYCRVLDLESATHNMVYIIGETAFARQTFISKPANCMIMRLFVQEGDGKISFTAKLDRGHYSDGVKKTESKDGIYLYGNLGKGGFDFGMMLKAKSVDGNVRVTGESLIVEDATEVILFFGADTSYHLGEMDIERTLEERLNQACNTEYKQLFWEHVKDYTGLYNRVTLDLEDEKSKLLFNYGARKRKRMVSTIKLSIMYAFCIMTLGTIVFCIFPEALLRMFDASEHMLSMGIPALRIISTHFPIAAFCIIIGSVFQALGKAVYSMINSIMRQIVVLLPAAYLLSLTGNVNNVWWAFPIAEGMSFAVTTIFLVKIYKDIISKIPE